MCNSILHLKINIYFTTKGSVCRDYLIIQADSISLQNILYITNTIPNSSYWLITMTLPIYSHSNSFTKKICVHYMHMVPILDSNSETGAHVRSDLCYLICSRLLIRSEAVTNRIFSPKRPITFMRFCKMFWITI